MGWGGDMTSSRSCCKGVFQNERSVGVFDCFFFFHLNYNLACVADSADAEMTLAFSLSCFGLLPENNLHTAYIKQHYVLF